jgi:hypothetical protein
MQWCHVHDVLCKWFQERRQYCAVQDLPCEYCACKDLWTFKKIRMIKFSERAQFSDLETICHSKKYANLLCKWCLKVHYSGIQTLDTSISKSYNFLQLEPNSKIQKDLKSAKFIFSNLKFIFRPSALFCSFFWHSIQTPFERFFHV